MTVPGVETEEEILENGPCQTVEELKQFDTSLENKETRTKMVINTAIYSCNDNKMFTHCIIFCCYNGFTQRDCSFCG